MQRITAFSHGMNGGNPAGVVLCEVLPPADRMLAIAAEFVYSETVFAARANMAGGCAISHQRSRCRFAATQRSRLGPAIALVHGDGTFALQLNDTWITVAGWRKNPALMAPQSPRTHGGYAQRDLVEAALGLFSFTAADLDPRLPPAIAEAGARHLVRALTSRQKLAAIHYDVERGRRFMIGAGIVTISLVQAETNTLFHARNPFAAGGVYEDAATGAAAAALAGYLRDLEWPHGGMIEILQGEEMGMPSRLRAETTSEPGASIQVSGEARQM